MAKETETELAGFTLPMNVRLAQGESGLMKGNNYNNGMNVSGIVEKLTVSTAGVVTLHVRQRDTKDLRRVYVWATGMMAEELFEEKAP